MFSHFMTQPNVDLNAGKLPVFVLLGQSNMVGEAPIAELPAEYSGVITGAQRWTGSSFVDLEATDIRFGPEFSFCKNYLAISGESEMKIIKYAVGATSLAVNWLPPSGAQYTTAITTIDAAIAALTPGTFYIAGFVWVQGETDSQSEANASAYADNLRLLIDSLREEYLAYNAYTIPFIASEIGFISRVTYYQQDWLRIAHNDVVATRPAVYISKSSDLTFNADGLHYNGNGQVNLGLRLSAAAYNRTVYNMLLVPFFDECSSWFDATCENAATAVGDAFALNGEMVSVLRSRYNGGIVTKYGFSRAVDIQKPTIATNVINGLQVLRFDGTDDSMEVGSVLSLDIFGANAGEVFLVQKTDIDKAATVFSKFNQVFNISPNSSGNMVFDFANTAGGRLTGATPSGVVGSFSATNFSRKAGNTASIAVNGVTAVSGTSTGTLTNGLSTMYLGYNGTANFFDGDFCEMFTYKRELTADEKSQVYAYLNSKYGFSI